MARTITLGVFLAIAALPALPEIADSASNGFTVKIAVQIQAPPEAVYRRLIQVAGWWSPAHTFSHDAKNLSLEEKAGGCFCETLPNGGSVRHMQVLMVAPGKSLVLSGALGPLQTLAATGTMSIELEPSAGETKLTATYAVNGYLAAGMNTWAAPVDRVLGEQFSRLKNLVEHGDPAATATLK
jgi:uncharacterized protein YndB with AHSA1/START domain